MSVTHSWINMKMKISASLINCQKVQEECSYNTFKVDMDYNSQGAFQEE